MSLRGGHKENKKRTHDCCLVLITANKFVDLLIVRIFLITSRWESGQILGIRFESDDHSFFFFFFSVIVDDLSKLGRRLDYHNRLHCATKELDSHNDIVKNYAMCT